MIQRLESFLAAENISQAQFAENINITRAGISHILTGRNKPSYEFILNTMNAFPRLNIEWLLTGKGKMYKDDEASEGLLFSGSQTEPRVQSQNQTQTQGRTQTQPTIVKPQPRTRRISKIVALYEDNTFEEFTSDEK